MASYTDWKTDWRQTQFVGAKFAYIGKVLRLVPYHISTAMFINIHWMEISLQNLLPFFQKSFFVKDCIEEITRFVVKVCGKIPKRKKLSIITAAVRTI